MSACVNITLSIYRNKCVNLSSNLLIFIKSSQLRFKINLILDKRKGGGNVNKNALIYLVLLDMVFE